MEAHPPARARPKEAVRPPARGPARRRIPPRLVPAPPASSKGGALPVSTEDGHRRLLRARAERTPTFDKTQLIGDQSGTGREENYSADEIQLNNFLRLHPMLSMEAAHLGTSRRSATLFQGVHRKRGRAVVGRSHDELSCASERRDRERPC